MAGAEAMSDKAVAYARTNADGKVAAAIEQVGEGIREIDG
jgi:hypothetical protein